MCANRRSLPNVFNGLRTLSFSVDKEFRVTSSESFASALFHKTTVQAHDILYTVSLDILYTPARLERRRWMGCLGGRWMFINNVWSL